MLEEQSRKKNLQSPGQIHEYVRVTSVSTFLVTITGLILLIALAVWAFQGTVSDKINYTGVVFPEGGVTDITLPHPGDVRQMTVRKGEHVSRGQEVALVSIEGSYSNVSSISEGIVIDSKMEGESFYAMEPIISLVSDSNVNLIAYTTNTDQRDLKAGMKAQIWPADENRDEIGYFTGTIVQIGRYPVSEAEVHKHIRNAGIAKEVTHDQGGIYEVTIALDRDSSGELCWSFGKPDDVDVSVGTLCKVRTEYKRRSVVQYLFEKVRTGIHKLQE